MLAFADALVRLAEVLNVSVDHLLIDDIRRRPLHHAPRRSRRPLATAAELEGDDLELVLSFIDALLAKNRLRALAGGLG